MAQALFPKRVAWVGMNYTALHRMKCFESCADLGGGLLSALGTPYTFEGLPTLQWALYAQESD
jgi:hypothetical protein